jgi:Zn-dependent membrane protease YugP
MHGMENLELLLWIAPALSAGLAAGLWFRYVGAQSTDAPVGMSGFAVARHILDSAGLGDVAIEPTPGNLSDHYESGARTVRLSNPVYHGRSVVAVGVAGRVAGHALQHRVSPLSISIQNLAAAGASFGSGPGLFIAVLGFLFGQQPLVLIGVALFHAAFVLQVLCLPFRLDACRRARKNLADMGLFDCTLAASIERIMRASALLGLAVVLRPITAPVDCITRFLGGGMKE